MRSEAFLSFPVLRCVSSPFRANKWPRRAPQTNSDANFARERERGRESELCLCKLYVFGSHGAFEAGETKKKMAECFVQNSSRNKTKSKTMRTNEASIPSFASLLSNPVLVPILALNSRRALRRHFRRRQNSRNADGASRTNELQRCRNPPLLSSLSNQVSEASGMMGGGDVGN